MNKKVRIALYITSIVLTVTVLLLLIFNKQAIKPTGTAGVITEEVEGTDDSGQENTNAENVNEENSNTESINTETVSTESTNTENINAETDKESVTIVFAGDVLIAEAMEQYYDTEGVTRIVSEELLAEMRNADICMVNNEFQFSNRGTPMEDKQFTFRTDPRYVQILLDMGVDIVSLANNHSIDFGTEALEDTFVTLDDAGILYAGAGDTKERAEKLQIIEVNGKKFGFLAATRVIPVSEWNIEYGQPGLFATYDDTRLVSCVKAAREVCDFLTVYVHWGIEREAYPQEYQTSIAKNCFAAGADVVIGAHPHVLQGIEFIEDKPVFYSLGNYVFAQKIAKTALVKIEIDADGEVSYTLIPAYAESGKTKRFEGEEAKALFDYMNEISGKDYIDEEGKIVNIQ